MPEIAIVAGEASGDASGAALVKELLARCPDLTIWGAGGEKMRNAGVDVAVDLSVGGAIGIVQSLALAPKILRKYLQVRNLVLARRPDLLVLIDFGAFNVRLGSKARKAGIKSLYYFPPSSWRRNLKSTGRIKACADKVITPFPWSEELLRAGGSDAVFLGHPLLDIVKPTLSCDEFRSRFAIDDNAKIIGLLPGSRGHEIRYNLPIFLECANAIKAQIPETEFIVAAGPNGAARTISQKVKSCGVSVRIAEELTYDVIAHSDFLLVCSGTATLEAAILGTPMVVVYAGGVLMKAEYLIRRRRVLESFIGMPNILAGREICPEFYAYTATSESITKAALDILQDSERMKRMKEDLASVKKVLGQTGATARAALTVMESI